MSIIRTVEARRCWTWLRSVDLALIQIGKGKSSLAEPALQHGQAGEGVDKDEIAFDPKDTAARIGSDSQVPIRALENDLVDGHGG